MDRLPRPGNTRIMERFTERARRVLLFGRYEASQRRSRLIEPEHLLLGLIREGKGGAWRLLEAANIQMEDIRQNLEQHMTPEKTPTSIEIPFNDNAKRVLRLAGEEADGLRHNHIGTEHLLLGLLREGESMAASILAQRGMSLEKTRIEIATLRARKSPLV